MRESIVWFLANIMISFLVMNCAKIVDNASCMAVMAAAGMGAFIAFCRSVILFGNYMRDFEKLQDISDLFL